MDFEKKNNFYKTVMLIIITALITFLITGIAIDKYYLKTRKGLIRSLATAEATDFDTRTYLINEYLKESYIGEIPDKEILIESAIKGYIAGLGDEYTEYLTKAEYEELMVNVDGNFVGIGVYMAQDKYDNVVILLPIKGSPAEEAGLKTGDIITKINGEDCTGLNLNIVADKIKGEEGTIVELEIKRENEIINKKIERRKVEINQIESDILEDNIGYIQILSFDDNCSEDFKNKLQELQNKGIKSLIIDVRDNGGGIVEEAINISELFIPKDKIIMREIVKNGKEKNTIAKKDKMLNDNIKIVILANENTASASEILIGALKDNNIATVVGKKTYGKGVMQEVVSISSGGALKVTIEEFRTPNGDTINKKGIEPDILVDNDMNTEQDEQLQKAIEELKK